MGHIILPERWKCGAQSRSDREEVDRCTLEVLLAYNRPQELPMSLELVCCWCVLCGDGVIFPSLFLSSATPCSNWRFPVLHTGLHTEHLNKMWDTIEAPVFFKKTCESSRWSRDWFRESRILCVILRERNPHRPSHQQVRVQRLGPHQMDRKCMRLDVTQHVESHRTSTPLTRQQPCSGRAGDRRENRNGTRSSNTPHDISPEGFDQGDVVPWVIASKTSHLTLCFGGCLWASCYFPCTTAQAYRRMVVLASLASPAQVMKKVPPAAE